MGHVMALSPPDFNKPGPPTAGDPPETIIICGMGRVGNALAEYLVSTGTHITCIDSKPAADHIRPDGSRILAGDCRDPAVLKRAGVENAQAVIAVTNDDQINLRTALMARGINENARLVARIQNEILVERLGAAIEHLQALSTSRLTAPLIVAAALKNESAVTEILGSFNLGLPKENTWELARLRVGRNSALIGLTAEQIAERQGAAVAGIGRDPAPMRLIDPSEPKEFIRAGDWLLLAGPTGKWNSTGGAGNDLADNGLRWASGWRQLIRFSRSAFPYDLSVPFATLALVLVLLASTMLFATVLEKSLADSVFRSVSIVATGADMHESDYHQKPWLKFFVSGLRIVGAALLALFTALLTNYILKARLRDVLLVTRVPDSGHVVVCGMGKVGFEVTKLLQARQIPLVVIERDPQCPYLENLRRDGVPIIAGDAGNEVSLGQARSAGARAVIAVTSNDLVNLQIALVAKGISGREQTVVLLQSDPTLADLLRDEANLKNALSIPDLVAPAIAAAAFGERVHALFRLGKSTYAMVSVTLDKNTRLTRKSINQMARDMGGMVPLFVHDSSGTRHLVQAPGLPEHLERLTGLIPISNMRDRVISRQSITMARPPAG